MFAIQITESDAFLDMPPSAQSLYFHMGLKADDEGFIGSPKRIMRELNSSNDDIKILIAKKFLIAFDSGVVVIKHWLINNTIRADRRKATTYTNERSMLCVKPNGSYKLIENSTPQPTDNQLTTKRQPNDGIDKISIGEIRLEEESINTLAPSADANDTDAKFKIPLSSPKEKPQYHPVTESDIAHYSELYPAVDVESQIRCMIGWCESNPGKRKTKTGVKGFITRWLSKAQDKGGRGSPHESAASASLEEYKQKVIMEQTHGQN